MSNRLDNAHDLTYPTTPDTRGSTRVNYKRRPYYMGPYESPLSHIMFGLWKHHLQETGEAPSTKDIRPIAEKLLESGEIHATTAPNKNDRRGYYLAAVGFTLSFFLALNIFFSSGTPIVDGTPMSAEHVKVIRGLRALGEDMEERRAAMALTPTFPDIFSELPIDGGQRQDGKSKGPTPIH